ncbi:MAG: deoxyribonuclease IV [Bacilli bacterium]|nr:deoxyribonuclease IV [Bacilli bacterium]
MNELIIGSHVSFKKGTQLVGSVNEALSYGANTFMFYTGAPQNTKREKIDLDLTKEAQKIMKENNIDINNVIIHAPYIINLANTSNMDFSCQFLSEELKRAEELGINKIVLHPGSHVGCGEQEGLKNIIFGLNKVLAKDTKTKICLETMAGKGSELGINFEQLKFIIDNVTFSDKIMVCLDTCHINDAGYDIRDFDKVLDQFDKIIGLNKLACIHINDSKNDINAHKDRHENIGLGTLGFDNIINIIYNPLLKDVPKILETPYVSLDDESKERLYPPYKFEIEMIRNKKNNLNLMKEIRSFYK